MRFEISLDIDASPETVWAHLIDIEHWPESTASVTRVERLDDGPFGIGTRARMHQPRLPAAIWTVTGFEPGRSFTWESRTPGVVTTGGHFLDPRGDTVSLRLTLDQKGLAAPLASLLYGRLTRRYVTMEAEGLKRRSET
ncbi:SRPBCC family protein [Actinomadura viridis]|uniref:SRPBCC family protein n=1 Tax=Actinomadura viridis TaxID=58110 RepID=UPI0036C27279